MTKLRSACGAVFVALFIGAAGPASAQIRRTTPDAPPPQIDPATIPMPNLAFTPTPQVEENYDKYFYFNRADTDFMTAYGDLRECDDYARGAAFHTSYTQTPYPYTYTMAGAIGGMIGNVVADMVFGSAERRRQRRINMLTCMRFKDYRVFGLPETLWEQFNFEEGNRRVPEPERQRLLQLQARVASGPAPTVGEVTQ
jgi:hypothetical protein